VTNRKGQNSILYVATLGVYVGLLLAGATPQVFANAATTRNFDIKDEIEFQDKLDRDPDSSGPSSGADSLANATREKFVPLARLLKQFRSFLPIGIFHSTARLRSTEAAAIVRLNFVYDDLEARAALPRYGSLQVNHLARSSIDLLLTNDVH
jgi:hypothetical protein